MIKVWVKDEMKNVALAACSKTYFSVALLPPVLSVYIEWIVSALYDFVVEWSSLLSMNFLMASLSEMMYKGFMDYALVPLTFHLKIAWAVTGLIRTEQHQPPEIFAPKGIISSVTCSDVPHLSEIHGITSDEATIRSFWWRFLNFLNSPVKTGESPLDCSPVF